MQQRPAPPARRSVSAVFPQKSRTSISRACCNTQLLQKPSNRRTICCAAMPPRFLIAFDFDHTVVDGNSDTWIYKALPGQVLPPEIKAKYVRGAWTKFMNVVFEHMSEQGVSKQRMEEVMGTLPLAPGMQELLDFLALHKSSFDSVIVSDANNFFISSILNSVTLTLAPSPQQPDGTAPTPPTTMSGNDLFVHVFTNISEWLPSPSEGGAPLLHISPPHTHTCPRCTIRNPNMCKRTFLLHWIEERRAQGREYDGVMYVGDGGNDFCPCSMLAPSDHAFVRYGMVLHKELIAGGYVPPMDPSAETPTRPEPDNLPPADIKAQILVWKSALEIKESLEQRLKAASQ